MYEPSKLYLIQNFQKHCHGSNGIKCRFGKERCTKQINDIQEWQKKNPKEFQECVKESGVTTQERKEVEVGTLMLGNDKNTVIGNKVLSYF